MFCYNRTEGGDFMPVGVLTNVCAVFIGTFIGGFIKKILPKHLIEELPKVFGICSVTIGITSILNVKTLPMVIMAIILGFVIGELCHLYDHVHDIFAFLLDKLPFHIEGNQEEYMHLYLLVVLMFSMSGMGLFGALTEGMSGDASVLISKSVLDFFTAVLFGAALGYAQSLICVPQLLILLACFFLAKAILPFVNSTMIADFKACGGVITMITGLTVSKSCSCTYFSHAFCWSLCHDLGENHVKTSNDTGFRITLSYRNNLFSYTRGSKLPIIKRKISSLS